MRRIAFLILVLSILCTAAFAQSDKVWTKQFPANDISLNMSYSSELQRLYVQVDGTVNKSSIDNFALNGLFLARNARIQGLWINGQLSKVLFVNSLNPTNFQPALEQAQLLDSNGLNRYHILALNNFASYPESIPFRLSYYLEIPAFKKGALNQQITSLPPETFWYPKNLLGETHIKFKLITTTYNRVMLGDALVPYTDQDYQRIHAVSFSDEVFPPLTFKLIKE